LYEVNLFKPFEKVLCYDDFDKGFNGWNVLLPNFQQNQFDYYPGQKKYTEWGSPMLSSATFSYLGTHGSLNGTYSLKLATKAVAGPADEQPVAGSMSHAIKRMTLNENGLVKFEMWYAIKSEQTKPDNGLKDIKSFGFVFDIQDEKKRYFCGIRYLNSVGDAIIGKWQYAKAVDGEDKDWGDVGQTAESDISRGDTIYVKRGIDPSWLGKRYADGSSDSFQDIPNGKQRLCYNESVDKINWHYFSLTVDTVNRKYVSFQSINKVYDLSAFSPTLVDAYPNINQLINPILWIETCSNRRAFLFIDSLIVSVKEGC